MKKLFLLLLLATAYGHGQGVTNSDFVTKHIIKGKIELNGHEPKGVFIFESTLKCIKIYERDSKKEYEIRECREKECKIIHLKEVGILKINPYIITRDTHTQLFKQ